MTDLSWGNAKPTVTIEIERFSFRGDRKWYLFCQVHGFFSMSCVPVSRCSNVDSIANFITILNLDTATTINLTVILTDQVDVSLSMLGFQVECRGGGL